MYGFLKDRFFQCCAVVVLVFLLFDYSVIYQSGDLIRHQYHTLPSLTRGKKKAPKNSSSYGVASSLTTASRTTTTTTTTTMSPTTISLNQSIITTTTTARLPGPLCPVMPSRLLGRLKVVKTPVKLTTVENRQAGDMGPGGYFKPLGCASRSRVAIIIPFRDRDEHLSIFLNHILPILKRQQLEFGIYVIEQQVGSKFNRAMLMNIGYAESIKDFGWRCFVFHDVDLLPEDDRNIYSCPSSPRHLSAAVDSLGYKLPYQTIFGGVSALTEEQLIDVNGFSNKFFGWGGEDDDFYNRIHKKGYKLSRYPMNVARYSMIKHKKEKANPQRFNLINGGTSRMAVDGINSLKYKLVNTERLKLFTKITVEINQNEKDEMIQRLEMALKQKTEKMDEVMKENKVLKKTTQEKTVENKELRERVYGQQTGKQLSIFERRLNVASGKTVTASSKYNNDKPASLTDGKYQQPVADPWNGFHTALEENPWVQIDLGKPYSVDAVKVYNRFSSLKPTMERLFPFEVRIGNSMSGMSNSRCGERSFTVEDLQVSASNPYPVSCGGLIGRYVTVRLLKKTYLNLCEIEVYSYVREIEGKRTKERTK